MADADTACRLHDEASENLVRIFRMSGKTRPDRRTPKQMAESQDILWNWGAGILLSGAKLDLTAQRHAIVVDLEGDGDLDLVRGTPLATIDSPPLDVNGDGAPDLILTTGTNNRHEVLLNHGRGSFLPIFALNNLSSKAITVAADLDGDSLVDLVAIGPRRIELYFSQLRAVERDCNSNGIPDGCDITAGRSADVNRDGVPDECEGVQAFVRGDCNADGASWTWSTPSASSATSFWAGRLRAV